MTTSPKPRAKSSAQVAAKPVPAAAKKSASKPAARPASKPAAKPVAKPGAKAPAPASFLRFYHSQALREKTLRVLSTLEAAPDPTQHKDALADLVIELTQTGMDYFFIKQLKQAKASFILQQSANLSMVGALQVMGSVVRKIIVRMEAPQLLSVCNSIRQLSR